MIPSINHYRISVKGSRAALEAFRKSVISISLCPISYGTVNEFSFNAIIPFPEEMHKNISVSLWEAVTQNHWESSSDALGTRLKELKHELEYKFTTLGKPALKAFKVLVKKHKSLKFQITIINPRDGFNYKLLSRNGDMLIHRG